MSAANKSQHEQPTQTETEHTNEQQDASVHNAEAANGEQPQAQAAQTDDSQAGADEKDTAMDDETQALMDDLQKAQQELAAFKDQYLRARAEVENIRRRADEEVAKARKFAVEGFAESLIPVRDSLEAALNQEDQTVEVLFEGVQTTLKQLDSAFERRSEEHTSELQSRGHLVCRLLLEKKKKKRPIRQDRTRRNTHQRCAGLMHGTT